MGPPQAKEALKQCVAVGADEAVLITDRAFKDADTLATGYALSMTARQLDAFDLIVCGKHTLDGETGQVGPQIAEHFGLVAGDPCDGYESRRGKTACRQRNGRGA